MSAKLIKKYKVLEPKTYILNVVKANDIWTQNIVESLQNTLWYTKTIFVVILVKMGFKLLASVRWNLT